MEKYQNTYRIQSARASWWDYSVTGTYFITLCTSNCENLFGDIQSAEMIPSAIGKIVIEEWDRSFDIRAELFCDAFVLMPNHLHAILRIEDNGLGTPGTVETHGRASLDGTTESINQEIHHIETHGRASLPSGIACRSSRSISSFVAGFKSTVTKRINEHRNTPKVPVWQARFHDHIIRDEANYHRISEYIANNPASWETDKFFNVGY